MEHFLNHELGTWTDGFFLYGHVFLKDNQIYRRVDQLYTTYNRVKLRVPVCKGELFTIDVPSLSLNITAHRAT